MSVNSLRRSDSVNGFVVKCEVRAIRGRRCTERLNHVEATEVREIVEADLRRRHGQVDDGEKQAVLVGADMLVEVLPRQPPVADRQRLWVRQVLARPRIPRSRLWRWRAP